MYGIDTIPLGSTVPAMRSALLAPGKSECKCRRRRTKDVMGADGEDEEGRRRRKILLADTRWSRRCGILSVEGRTDTTDFKDR